MLDLGRSLTAAALTGLVACTTAGAPLQADTMHQHGHGSADLRPVPTGAPVPGLELEAYPDPTDGYNLHLLVTDFSFTPESVGRDSEAVAGHAHLYVNGKKIGRLYGPWAHLPMALLAEGENRVRVSLNDNRHLSWAEGDKAIGAEIALAGPVAWSGTALLLDLAESDNAPTFEIQQGESVRLEVRADRDLALHLHGYDLEADVAPGHPAVLTFQAAHGGRFALVAHGETDLLGRSEAPLAYIEVR